MKHKAHEIIDRLARLEEAAPVEEPEVDPDVLPDEPAPGRERPPAPRRTSDPYELPPDFDPGQMPSPKSQDEDQAIADWLQATQQPIQDWDWDGNELRLLLDDGSTEVYSRQQLEDTGVFSGESAFAESKDDDDDDDKPSRKEKTGPGGRPMGYDDLKLEAPDKAEVETAIAAENPSSNEAAGVLDMILGRTPCSGSANGAEAITDDPENEVVSAEIVVDGEKGEELVNAVSDVVKAIIGIMGGDSETAEPSSEKPDEKKKKKKKEPEPKKKEKDKDDEKKEPEEKDEKSKEKEDKE